MATHYEAGPVREMVHKLKYEGMTDLASVLGEVLISGANQKRWEGFVVVPVPLHRRRLAERGFNQAGLLAVRLAKRLGLSYQPTGLGRVRETATQIMLGRRSRHENLYKAFRANRSLAGEKVLLADDVMTTGATLEDCARACRDAGARQVWAAVIARG